MLVRAIESGDLQLSRYTKSGQGWKREGGERKGRGKGKGEGKGEGKGREREAERWEEGKDYNTPIPNFWRGSPIVALVQDFARSAATTGLQISC